MSLKTSLRHNFKPVFDIILKWRQFFPYNYTLLQILYSNTSIIKIVLCFYWYYQTCYWCLVQTGANRDISSMDGYQRRKNSNQSTVQQLEKENNDEKHFEMYFFFNADNLTERYQIVNTILFTVANYADSKIYFTPGSDPILPFIYVYGQTVCKTIIRYSKRLLKLNQNKCCCKTLYRDDLSSVWSLYICDSLRIRYQHLIKNN